MSKAKVLTTTDSGTRTLVNLLRRRAFMSGYRVSKKCRAGFKLVDVRGGNTVLGDDEAGASFEAVARFLKVPIAA